MSKVLLSRRKILLILVLVMFFQVTNVVVASGNTKAMDKRQTTDTFISLGGNYSIQYILGKYNVFSFKDVTGSHIVGPVVAKERTYKTASNGTSLEPIDDFMVISDLSEGILSYVGNIEKRKGSNKPTFEMNHVYNKGEPQANLYTRFSGVNIWNDKHQYNLYIDNKNDSFLNPNNYNGKGKGEIFQNDDFIDFDEAKIQIKKESQKMLTRSGRVVEPDPKTGYLKIEAGYNYIINDASNLRIVDIIFPEGYDGITNYYPYSTFINIAGNNLALSGTKFEPIDNIGSSYVQGITFPKIEGEKYQFFPDIYVNGSPFEGTTIGPSGSVDYGEKLNILWNMPNIKTLDGGYKMAKAGYADILGHIVAPDVHFYNYSIDYKGDVNWAGGNMNGGAIVDSWYSGKQETHYWPYKDDLENPIFKDSSIKGVKNLTGKKLKDNEFKFKLEFVRSSVKDGLSSTVFPEVSNNSDGTITFPSINFKKPGVYEFRIKEVTDLEVDKITFDKTEYKVVATVTEDLGSSILDVHYDFFKVKDENGVDLDSHINVDKVVFNNKYDYILPATGGVGTRIYSILGMSFMISSIVVFMWKKL